MNDSRCPRSSSEPAASKGDGPHRRPGRNESESDANKVPAMPVVERLASTARATAPSSRTPMRPRASRSTARHRASRHPRSAPSCFRCGAHQHLRRDGHRRQGEPRPVGAPASGHGVERGRLRVREQPLCGARAGDDPGAEGACPSANMTDSPWSAAASLAAQVVSRA
jgi:hypothetical protein